MKHLSKFFVTGALLISSFSALSLNLDNEATENTFQIGESSLNDDFIKTKRASDNIQTPTDLNVGPAIAQKIDLPNGKTTIRFLAPAKVQSITKGENGLELITGGEFGFNINYTYNGKVIDVNMKNTNYFLSVKANDKGYVASDLSEFSNDPNYGKMNDFYNAAFHTTTSEEFNCFITMEVRNITSDFVDAIQATPYYIKEGTQNKVTRFSKKADTSGIPFYETEINGVKSSMPTKRIPELTGSNIGFVVSLPGGMTNPSIYNTQLLSENLVEGNHYAEVSKPNGGSLNLDELNFTFDNNGNTYSINLDQMNKKYPNFTFEMKKNYQLSNFSLDDNYNFVFDIKPLNIVYKNERENIVKARNADKIQVLDSFGNKVDTYTSKENGYHTVFYDGLTFKYLPSYYTYIARVNGVDKKITLTDTQAMFTNGRYVIDMDGIKYVINGDRINPNFLWTNYMNAFDDSEHTIAINSYQSLENYHLLDFNFNHAFNNRPYHALQVPHGTIVPSNMIPSGRHAEYEINAWVDNGEYLNAKNINYQVNRDIVLEAYISVQREKFKTMQVEGKNYLAGYKTFGNFENKISGLYLPAFDEFGNRIQGISSEAFKGIKIVDKIIIPDECLEIQKSAFENAFYSTETQIYLPNSLKSIAEDAFYVNFNEYDYNRCRIIAEGVRFYTTNRVIFETRDEKSLPQNPLKGLSKRIGGKEPRWYGCNHGWFDFATGAAELQNAFQNFDGNIIAKNLELTSLFK